MQLHGQGFTLRKWRSEDVVSIQKHADNPNVYSFLMDRFPHPYTMGAAETWVTAMLCMEPNYNLVIEVNGLAVGVIGLEMREDVYRKAPLIGYWISETLWGKGIMTAAIKLMTTYAFANFDITRIQAGVLSNNPRSMHVLEKAGFTKEGVLKNNIIKNGVVLDEHIYGITSPAAI